jgi:alanine-synthesizing transaminase
VQNSKFFSEGLPSYMFAAINNLKKEAIKNGLDIIDFSMGNPDFLPPAHVIESLVEEVKNPKSYGYGPTGGADDLKKALCNYYQRRFGVDLDYQAESLITIGAKEGITSLASAISNSEEYIAISDPSYPIHYFGFKISGSKVERIKNKSAADFLDGLKNLIAKKQKKPIAILVNYPNNPTGETVDLQFYQNLVDFCFSQKIYIISDLAYGELYFEKKDRPCSILECKKAKEIAIEFSSTSKSYSMAGCRVGFAVGNQDLIASLSKIKSYLDYGSFFPLQKAAISALSEKSDSYLANIRNKYSERADFLIKIAQEKLNWEIKKPKGGMYLWTKLPKEFRNLNSLEFCQKLIINCGVAFTPGSGFGKNGEGYIRISLIHDEKKIIEAIARIFQLIDILAKS